MKKSFKFDKKMQKCIKNGDKCQIRQYWVNQEYEYLY